MKRLTFRALALRQSNLQYSPTDATPQFLCGISHTLSRPAKFLSLFIYLSTREKCLSRGFYLAFSEPRRLDSNSCFFTVDCTAAISVLSCWVLENLYGISFLFPGDFCFQGEDKSYSIFTGSLRALTFQFCCESFTVKLSRKPVCLPGLCSFVWISFEQFRSRIRSHDNFVKIKDVSSRFKDRFWNVMLMTFYLNVFYLLTLKQVVIPYKMLN